MPEKIEFYRGRLRIDRDDLDGELTEQPELFEHVGRAHVHAMSREHHLKDELKTLEAKKYLSYRKDFEDRQEKTTETLLLSHVAKNSEVSAMRDQLMDAVKETGEWGVLKEAFQQRSYALKDLVVLFQASYFGTDSSTGPAKAANAKAGYEKDRKTLGEARERRRLKPQDDDGD